MLFYLVRAPEISTQPSDDSGLSLLVLNSVMDTPTLSENRRLACSSHFLSQTPFVCRSDAFDDVKDFDQAATSQVPSSSDCTAAAAQPAAQPEPH